MTVIKSRTRGLAPMTTGNLNDEASNSDASSDEFVESEDGELYCSEIRNGFAVAPAFAAAVAVAFIAACAAPLAAAPLAAAKLLLWCRFAFFRCCVCF